MNYLSVCSGIEAVTCAWEGLGWKPVGFSEIEPFPSAVLKHHYPSVPNLGDMTKYKEWNLDSIGLLVGGTPCQSFSVAGLRKGLEDPRGNLALSYVGILDHFRPKWFVWENVPGVLSSGGGRDFGSFLGAVAELGYGFAYRVLDAQYFGVAQRRKRVFVVGCLGDWQSAAKVLFEPESLRRDSPPSREKRKETAARTGVGVEISGPLSAKDYKDAGTDGLNEYSAKMVPVGYTSDGFASYKEGVGTLRATGGDLGGGSETFVTDDATKQFVYENHPSDSRVKEMGDVCQTVTSSRGTGGGNIPFAMQGNLIGRDKGGSHVIAGTTKASGGVLGGSSETFLAIPIHAQATQYSGGGDNRNNDGKGNGLGIGKPGDPMNTLDTSSRHAVAQPIPLNTMTMMGRPSDDGRMGSGIGSPGDPCPTITKAHSHAVAQPIAFAQNQRDEVRIMQVRRLTKADQHGIAYGFEPGITKREGNPSRFLENGTPTLRAHMGDNQIAMASQMSVRRLTPIECERLQGFPDNYTDIKPKGKDTPDGPRYKALGNSMAVPVMRWIGERINLINKAQEK